MNTTANMTSTPAFAPLSATAGIPRRVAPGIGFTFAVVASIGLWAGLGQGAIALLA